MKFKEFITRQRVAILIIGFVTFTLSLFIANWHGFNTLTGELFVDLAASSITVIFTALIIDYLSVREESSKTKNASGLAEDEIRATCFRVKGRMARLFGLEREATGRDNIGSREEARDYVENLRQEVDDYLQAHNMLDEETKLVPDSLPKYLERLQVARTELEQTLLLYQYAMSYTLRERVLSLRTELQIADNILGFIDFSEELNDANRSLIRIISQSIYDAIESVLGHGSREVIGIPIAEKNSRIA